MDNQVRQSEILFMWDARLCNPNGDMSMDNAPRFDDVDEKAIVSDVRVKRTIRDDLQYRKDQRIFINNEEIVKNGLKAEKRFDQLKSDLSGKDESDVFLSCIDNRLFGGVAPKSGLQLVGAVQFGWSKSLNKTETVLKQGTGAFATEDKESKDNNREKARYSKTFRVDNYIPYGLFALYGSVNRIHAQRCLTTEEDVQTMLDSMWHGTKFLNTRSKQGQKPRFLLRIIYRDDSKYFVGLLDELVRLENGDNSENLREINEAKIDFSRLVQAIEKAKDQIEKVTIVLDESMAKYKEDFNRFDFVEYIDDMTILTEEG
ncbi:MAG: type I-B CRISPR-associated protein Cas7/Csh2 [Thermodesulfobacteriota bacterium]|nr:type I-B CRISPR-associated protein Cas7/Csh2 [Thermodesulfobacteriota bacterium]